MNQEQEKRKQFREILFGLAKNDSLPTSKSECAEIYTRLEELYCSAGTTERFRHFYSDIFEVLSLVKQDMNLGTIDILGKNMRALYAQYEPISADHDISRELRKLHDHVSLDIARMSYSDAGDYRIAGKQTVQVLQNQVEKLTSEIKDARKQQEEMTDELKSQQREYVAILGIFAAVVITFIGGLAFSTSVLNNIDKVSTVKLMLISLTIGLVLVHVIFGLFHYMDRLVNSSFSSKKICALVISSIIIIALMFCVVYFLPYLKQLN